MNASTNKLSAEEIEARRRLLITHTNNSWNDDEFEAYVQDVKTIVYVPDELIEEATHAHNASYNDGDDDADADADAVVINPYQQDKEKKDARAARSKSFGSLATRQSAGAASTNNNNTINNKKGPGRPKNTKNKEGHAAGGDRKSDKYKNEQHLMKHGNRHQGIDSFMIVNNNTNNNNGISIDNDGESGGGSGGEGEGGVIVVIMKTMNEKGNEK